LDFQVLEIHPAGMKILLMMVVLQSLNLVVALESLERLEIGTDSRQARDRDPYSYRLLEAI